MRVEKGERIAKVLARAGLCSRREAERWIALGRVAVDGRVLASPAVTVGAAARVTVDGKPVAPADPARLWRYHKPAGLVTSHRDTRGRPTVFERLPEGLPRVVSVGRLDLTSEGLLLLTNAGGLARRLERPETGWTRRYRVRVFGAVDKAALARLADGLRVGGVDYRPLDARLDRRQGGNAWLTVSLKEGRNREVRRLMEHLGLRVNRLIRVAFDPMRVGIISIGYADGFSRRMSNGGEVVVQGKRCRVVGLVSMDLTLVDLSDAPEASVDDEATLIGPLIDAHQMATRCGTIPYEVLCGISKRVPRVYE